MPRAPRRVRALGVTLAVVLAACGVLERSPPLADRFPQALGGGPFAVDIFTAQDSEIGVNVPAEHLGALGVEMSEVILAVGPSATLDDPPAIQVLAFQYPGADERQLAAAFRDGAAAAETPLAPVSRAGREGWSQLGFFIFVRHDVIYSISGEGALVDELIAAIP